MPAHSSSGRPGGHPRRCCTSVTHAPSCEVSLAAGGSLPRKHGGNGQRRSQQKKAGSKPARANRTQREQVAPMRTPTRACSSITECGAKRGDSRLLAVRRPEAHVAPG